MATGEKNYTKTTIGSFKALSDKGRLLLGNELNITGCEISLNSTPAGTYTPFVHAHQLNEEVYIILSGKGEFKVDADEFPIEEGSVIRVAPKGERAIKASENDLVYICIQAQANSLTKATQDDGVISQSVASWMTEA